jgi:hypothetical protein
MGLFLEALQKREGFLNVTYFCNIVTFCCNISNINYKILINKTLF